MRLGIFAKTFARASLPEILAAVKSQGLDCVQFNLACVGLETVPAQIPAGLAVEIGRQFAAAGVTMAAVSGTFNLIDPDRAKRETLLANLAVLAGACQAMGTKVITLCTGTCDPADMWKAHPQNDSPQSWRQLVESLRTALALTARSGVTLAIEPEPANVVASAEKAIRLVDEIDSPRLKFVFDGVNLMHGHPAADTADVLRRALELLAPRMVIAHAKDLESGRGPGDSNGSVPKPAIDYPAYLRLLVEFGCEGPLILHGMSEREVPAALDFLKQSMHQAGLAPAV